MTSGGPPRSDMFENLGLEKIRELQVTPAWREWQWRRWLFGAVVFLALTTILALDFLPDEVAGLQRGRPSPKTVKATRDVQIIDEEATTRQRAEAARAIGKVYNRDLGAESQSIDALHRAFSAIREARGSSANADARFENATPFIGALAREDFDRMVELTPDKLAEAEARVVPVLERLYSEQVVNDELAAKKERIVKIAFESQGDPDVKQAIAVSGAAYLVPNYIYDRDRTEQLEREAADIVKPVVVSRQKGEEIVGEGKIVTDTQFRLLRELGLVGRRIDLSAIAGYALISLALIAAFAIYLHNSQRKVYENGRLLMVLAIIIVGTVLIGKIAVSFDAPFLVPVAAAAMLTTLLLGAELAVTVTIVTALYSGVVAGMDLSYVLVWLIGGLFSIYTVWHIKQRTDLARAGLQISLVLGALAVTVTHLSSAIDLEKVAKNLVWGLASGMTASILTIGVLPFLEKVFGITTDIRLVELSYANQPVLRELMIKAPGTYNHSIMTGNLAELAAEQVGANPLIARVGAYYHDIGKIKRPSFFVENQVGGENPHDNTNPNLSCLIITSHVKEGIEIAEKNDLPKEIIDIIREHHGTSVVSYFFHRAKENLMKEEVCEADFRYTGSRPRSREAAIVMLADSVEAAARTIAKPTPHRLEQLIKRIIQQKLDDGQLARSDLTLKDLDKIATSFTQTLVSIYHSRIEYPLPTLPVRSANGNLVK